MDQQKPDLEKDLYESNYIMEKAYRNQDYCQNLYAALCNNDWIKADMLSILAAEYWHCSWRYAGGIVAELRNQNEDYIDFYCSGGEGIVQDDIAEDFARIGWQHSQWPED